MRKLREAEVLARQINDTASEATPRQCFFFGHPPTQRDNPHSDPPCSSHSSRGWDLAIKTSLHNAVAERFEAAAMAHALGDEEPGYRAYASATAGCIGEHPDTFSDTHGSPILGMVWTAFGAAAFLIAGRPPIRRHARMSSASQGQMNRAIVNTFHTPR